MTKAEVMEQYARNAVGCPYVMGATGKLCTVSMRKTQAKQYTDSAEAIEKYCMKMLKNKPCSECKYNGKPAYDCAQLVRKAAEAAGIALVSGATSQWKKTDWESQGEYDQRPKGQLLLVFRMDGKDSSMMQHVGIELPDGSCIHAKGHAYGVVHDKPGAYPWTHFGILKGMDLEVNEAAEKEEKMAEKVQPGMRAVVKASSGKTVNMRKKPNGALIAPVTVGADAKVLETSGEWSRIRVEVEGWMLSKFLEEVK